MFNKKYKKGMADAAKAYGAFDKKQEDALKHILEEVRQGKRDLESVLRELNGNIDGLYNYIDSKEKAHLYSLYTPFDIIELDKNNRLFLVGVLYRLTADKAPNENQQNYIRAVQRYLEIKEPPFGIDPMYIETIEDIPTQKAILQTVLEYLYLQDGDSYDETEYQQEFLDAFSVNTKGRKEIMDHIDLLYTATGAKGLAEKYGYVSEDQLGEIRESGNDIECQEIEKVIESWKDKKYCHCSFVSFSTRPSEMYSFSIDERVSKSECERRAKSVVQKVYDEASSLFSTTSTNSLSKLAYKQISETIEKELDEIQHHVRLFQNCDTIKEQMDVLQETLNLDKFRSELKEKLEDEIHESYYSMYDFSYFLDSVKYESDDAEMESGFWRLLEMAATSYSFDATDVYYEIENDAKKYAETYEENANRIAHDLLYGKKKKKVKAVLEEIRTIS